MKNIIGFSTQNQKKSSGRIEIPRHLIVRTEDVVKGNLWRCFPAINCDKVADIPSDYPGVIGAPITILDKICREQFEVVGMLSHGSIGPDRPDLYKRILIRNLKPKLPAEIDLVEYLGKMGIPVDVEYVQEDNIPEEIIPAYRRSISNDPCIIDGRTFAREHRI